MNDPNKNAFGKDFRKAAILACSLDPADADAIIDKLEQNQAVQLRHAMVELGEIDPQEQRRVIDEFFRTGVMSPTRETVSIQLDKPRARNPSAPPSEAPLPFRFLKEIEGDRLAEVLGSERPQTVALILSHLSTDQAGMVLGQLDPAIQADVIRRLVDLEQTDPQIVREVEKTLQARLSQYSGAGHSGAGPRRRVGVQDGPGKKTFDSLAACDHVLAEELVGPVVRFDDLVRLDDQSLAAVFRSSEPEVMMTSLVGASPPLIDRIVHQLSSREGKRLRRQLDHPGPIRLSDVEEARCRVAGHAHRLAAEGRITVPVDQSPVFESTYS